jgi:asparagine synthetase B (glutamine-hydrolysing)
VAATAADILMARFVAIQIDTDRPALSEQTMARWAGAWSGRFADGMRVLEPRIRFAGDRTAVILFDDDSGWAGIGGDHLYVGSPSRARALSGLAGVLIRFQPDSISARSDAVASRAVWYGHRNGVSVVSNSVRASVSVLREFRSNPAALGWMLSAGNLGPGQSWSIDVNKLGPASQVALSADAPPVVTRCAVEERVGVEDAAAVRAVLYETLEPLADCGRIALLLSGGVDSGVLLGALTDCGSGRTSAVTWGRRQALSDPLNDAWIARELAAAAGIPHVFLPIQWDASLDPDFVLDRFVRISEGTVDWIAGYVDRFAALQWLAASGLTRVVRGDQCFGSASIVDDVHLRRLVHAEHTADHPFLRRWRDAIPDVALAPEYDGHESESLSDWRDRLYRTVMIPYTLSPLTEAKTAFVEQYSPFLDLPMVSLARSLPSRLRDGKPLLRQLAREYHPDIRWAERASLQSEVGLLADTGLGAWVDTRVLTAAEAMGLPSAFGEDLVRQTAASRGSMRFITRLGTARFVRRVVPRSVVRRARSIAGPLNAPQRRIALRLIIAQRALEMLTDDARYGIAPCDQEHLVGKRLV